MLSEKLKSIREKLNMSLDEMAEILSIPKRTLAGYERNERTPSIEFGTQLCNKLNVNINWLLTNNGNIFINDENPEVGSNETPICPDCMGQIDIPYLEVLPEEAKLPEVSSVHTDLEIIQNHWQRDPEKLRIIPMQGDCLSTYWYPCKNRDILIIDTGSIIPTREGLYCYSTMNNSLIFIAKLSQSIDGTIKIEKYEANGEVVVKPVSLEKQKEVDFRVLGRVIKNVSLAL